MEFDTEDETFTYYDVPQDNPTQAKSEDETNYSSSVPMAGLPLAGAMMGLCLGGPVGVLAGVKLGGVAAVGGSILGYTGGSVIKEQKDMRKHIDDHYKNEPKLYVLTPKEEVLLSRRRTSLRTHPSVDNIGTSAGHLPATRHTPGARRRTQSESPRHLPTLRQRKRHCYRSSRNLSISDHRSHSSSPSYSPVLTRARLDIPSESPPPHLQQRRFRRLGDLTLEEQRSVIALINSDRSDRADHDYILTAHYPRNSRSPRRRLPTIDVTGPRTNNVTLTADSRRKQFARQQNRRASSLPDVLEEEK